MKAMRSIAFGTLYALVFATAASAHPGGHGEDEMPYMGPDCNAMSGDFDAGSKLSVSVYVYRGKVLLTAKADATVVGETVIGDCVSPQTVSGSFAPRALIKFVPKFADGKFAKELEAPDCCTATLTGDVLKFDKAPSLAWKRRKPQ
jgi:hypothetical protein